LHKIKGNIFKILTVSLVLVGFTFNNVFCQSKDFKSKFEEANVLMEEKMFSLALPVLKELLIEDPDNANINFKIGQCYFYSQTHKVDALPYLRKAVKNISKNYDPFMYTERGARIEAYYYLGRAMHIHYDIDSAIYYFNVFKEGIGKKHILYKSAVRQIEMCENAKTLMASPVEIKITNLGPKINSAYSEHSPVLSLDENEIFFTSRRLRADSMNMSFKNIVDGEYYEDVYVSYKNKKGEWGEPELLDFNSVNAHHATIDLSADYTTLFIYHDAGGNGDLYQSTLIDDRWSKPEPLGSDINSSAYETHLSISVDGQTLFFASDRKGGLGGKDIYMCKKLPNGEWGAAKNLGAPINSEYDEDAPHFHPDGKTLYFASTGHESMGGYDIFFSEIQSDGSWSFPLNIGYPINSTHDDVFYVASADGKRGYYSSYGGVDNYGEEDLYMLERVEFIEKPLTLLKGRLFVPENQTLPSNITVYLTDNETGELVGKSKPFVRTGSFVFIIPPGKNYNIRYEIGDKDVFNDNIFVPIGSEYTEINKEIMLDAINLSGEPVSAKLSDEDRIGKIAFNNLESIPVGMALQYVDDNGKVHFTEPIDDKGYFNFRKLASEDNLSLKLIGNVPCDDADIKIVDKTTQTITVLTFDHSNDCNFKAVVKEKTDIVGKIAFVNLHNIPVSLKIQYVDDNGKVHYAEDVDKNGFFAFRELQGDKNFNLKLIGDVPCDEADIKIVDKTNQSITILKFDHSNDCNFKAIKKIGKVAFVNLNDIPVSLKIQYIDDSGKIHFTEAVDGKGYFAYRELQGDKNLMLKLISDQPCDMAVIKIVDKSNQNITYVDFNNTADCIFKPIVKEKIAFEEYFSYNANKNQKVKEFENFINLLVKYIEIEGSVSISIESSASKVPTKTHKTNDNLSKLRSENAKKNVLDALAKQGINAEKVKFNNITTLVQGPTYKGDFKQNKDTYEKYQYVKIFTN
jgi:hypothetical protein